MVWLKREIKPCINKISVWGYYEMVQMGHKFDGPNQNCRDPSPHNSTKLNLNATWIKGKASIVVLIRNFDGCAPRLWYDKYECASTLIVKLLTI